MSKQSDFAVYVQLLFAMLFFGLSFVFTSYSLQFLPPVTLIVVRLLISTLVLLFFSRLRWVTRVVGTLQHPARGDIRLFFTVAMFQPFLYFLAENTGLLYASPAIASIVVGTIPVATPVFAWMIIRERIELPTVIGALLSFAGVFFLVLADAEATGADPLGVLLVSGAVVAAVGYSIVLRTLPAHYTALTVVAWQNLFGLLLFFPVFIVLDVAQLLPALGPAAAHGAGDALSTGLASLTAYAPTELLPLAAALVFLGVFPSSLSFIFLSRGIRTLGATRANVTTNLVPVFAALFSALVLGEEITIATVAGMAIVISGVLLSQLTRLRRRALAEP
ncbi:MAG: DMT family transporter [bacterium]